MQIHVYISPAAAVRAGRAQSGRLALEVDRQHGITP